MGISRRIPALPFLLLALLMQLGAPAAAARMAAAMADPFAAMPICSPDKGRGGAPDAPHRHDADQCAVCTACAPMQASLRAAPEPSPSEFSAPAPRPRSPVEAAPRGPPAPTPRARGPPAFA